MSKKMPYRTLVTMNMAEKRMHPGDRLALTLRNEDGSEGIFSQAQRVNTMFLLCYNFFPEVIALHPDHLAILRKQGKSLDVLIAEEVIPALMEVLTDLTELPRRIPFVADDSLDLFTVVARFTFPKEEAVSTLMDVLRYVIQAREEDTP